LKICQQLAKLDAKIEWYLFPDTVYLACWFILNMSTSDLKVKVIGQTS